MVVKNESNTIEFDGASQNASPGEQASGGAGASWKSCGSAQERCVPIVAETLRQPSLV
jgi:hypothetical protein